MRDGRKPPNGVLIYGAGAVGQAIAQLVRARGWRIAGAMNRAGAKVGRDLGDLAGSPPIGVTVDDAATAEPGSYGAEIAIVAVSDWLAETIPVHRHLLRSGLNVICLGAETSFPAAVDETVAAEIDGLARANGVTLTGCGLWDTYRLSSLRLMTGPCTALRGICHHSITDVNRFGAEVARLAGVGGDPGDVAGGGRSIYRVFLHQAVRSLGLTIAAVRERLEPIVSAQPIDCTVLDRTIVPGQVTGSRTVIEIDTREGVTARAEIDLRLTEPDEEEWIGWHIDGDPPVQLRLTGLDTGHATAASAACRIPDVIKAPPGLVTTDRLPPMAWCQPA